jgi:hypothetical protein
MRAIEILGEMSAGDKRTTDLLKRIANTDKDEQVRESAKELLKEGSIPTFIGESPSSPK